MIIPFSSWLLFQIAEKWSTSETSNEGVSYMTYYMTHTCLPVCQVGLVLQPRQMDQEVPKLEQTPHIHHSYA